MTSRSHASASVSTTLGGVPRVCRGPGTHWVTPNGGTRTSTALPGVRSESSSSDHRTAVAVVLRSTEAGSAAQVRSADRPVGRVGATAGRHQSSLRSAAHRVSSCRDDSWSLRRTADTWVSTVFTEMNSSLATSL